MPKFYGYARVSHRDQEKGDSVAGQKQRGIQYWELHFRDAGVEWGGFFEEPGHVSGRNTPFMRRKAGKEAIVTLQAGDVLYVDKVDRLWRDIHDFSDLLRWFKNHRVTVVFGNLMGGSFTTDTPLGDFMLGLLVLIGQLESDQMSDRIISNFEHQRSNGFFPHSARFAPLGTKAITAIPYVPTALKRPKKMLTWDMETRIVMAEIVKLHDIDGLQFGDISDYIEQKTQPYVPRYCDSRQWSVTGCAHAYLLEKQYALVQEPRYINHKTLPTRNDARIFAANLRGRARSRISRSRSLGSV